MPRRPVALFPLVLAALSSLVRAIDPLDVTPLGRRIAALGPPAIGLVHGTAAGPKLRTRRFLGRLMMLHRLTM